MALPRSAQRAPRRSKRDGGPLGGLAGTIKSLIGPQDGLSMIDLAIVAIACVLGTYFVTIKVLAPAAVNEVECNSTLLHTARNGSDGWTELDVAVVTDLDHDSRHVEKKNTWQSIIKKGTLRLSPKADQASVVWHDEQDYIVSSQISAGGRAMELSDLCVFNGKLLTADDRTGIVYEIKDEKAIPWLLLNDGPGNVTKGLKAEWMTVKDKHLYVGGLGKEWTTTTGEYVNDHPMWVKVVSPSGAIQHVSWYDVFVKVRRAIGIEYPGYMIHEAVQWSAIHKEWFFLPRRASKEVYTEVDDEHRGASVMIVADESFSKFRAVHIGKHDNPSRGYSALQFVPGTNDRVIVALKSEEKDGKPVASYLTVFDVKGKVILPDTKLLGAHKYEGIAFV